VLVDRRVDVTATFEYFARELHAGLETSIQDDNCKPQHYRICSDQPFYHHLVRVEVLGELQKLSHVLNSCGGTQFQFARPNSGIDITPPQAYDAETARVVTEE
jgi:hypothetical protein